MCVVCFTGTGQQSQALDWMATLGKRHAEADAAEETALPEISLRVASLDGVTLTVAAPRQGLVSDVKRTIGQARGLAPGLIELFIKGKEDALRNEARLDSIGVGDGAVLFILQKQGMCELA